MSSTWSTHELLVRGFPDPDVNHELPDLIDLHAGDILGASLAAFDGDGDLPRQRYFTAWMELVRLANKALRSYQAARVHLAEYRLHAYECRVVPHYRAVDNLEEAVAATHRGFLLATRLTPVAGHLRQPSKRQAVLLKAVHDYIGRLPAQEMHGASPGCTAVSRRSRTSEPTGKHPGRRTEHRYFRTGQGGPSARRAVGGGSAGWAADGIGAPFDEDSVVPGVARWPPLSLVGRSGPRRS